MAAAVPACSAGAGGPDSAVAADINRHHYPVADGMGQDSSDDYTGRLVVVLLNTRPESGCSGT